MKILVTGGSGFIGSNLIFRLLASGFKVVNLDKTDLTSKTITQDENYQYVLGDICDEGLLNKFEESEIGIIFHTAANANVPASVAKPIDDFRLNAFGTLNMLEFARIKQVKKFIFTSSVSVFDSNNDLPLSESSRFKASSPYGASKIAGENYCYAYHRTYGLDTNVVRFFNVYGEGINKLFVYDIINKAINSTKEITITGNGHQIRDYLFIDDLVEGMILVAKKGKAGEDYNIASGQKLEIIEILSMVLKIMGKSNLKVITTNISYPGDIKEWYADIKKIEKLGFSPKVDLHQGLIRTINYVIQRRP